MAKNNLAFVKLVPGGGQFCFSAGHCKALITIAIRGGGAGQRVRGPGQL